MTTRRPFRLLSRLLPGMLLVMGCAESSRPCRCGSTYCPPPPGCITQAPILVKPAMDTPEPLDGLQTPLGEPLP